MSGPQKTTICTLCFLSGVLIMLGYTTLRGSDAKPPDHVYELRLYHVNEGKMDALKARFRDHVDAIFRRHNMKSIGYWSPKMPRNLKTFSSIFSSTPAGRKRRRIGLLSKPIRNGRR